jgi:hypothetical protein
MAKLTPERRSEIARLGGHAAAKARRPDPDADNS